jgi:hypothetical protein
MILPPLIVFNVKVDNNFFKWEKKIVVKSLRAWEKASNNLIVFNILDMNMTHIDPNDYYVIHILKACSEDEVIKKADKRFNSKTNVGYAFYDGKQLFAMPIIDRIKDKKMLYKVTTHEIGHCITGWNHLEKPTGIMYHRVTKTDKITYDDLNLLIENIKTYFTKT